MPKFNRERQLIGLLKAGHAVLLIKTWDTSGVLAAGRGFADALEHPARARWDPMPTSVSKSANKSSTATGLV